MFYHRFAKVQITGCIVFTPQNAAHLPLKLRIIVSSILGTKQITLQLVKYFVDGCTKCPNRQNRR